MVGPSNSCVFCHPFISYSFHYNSCVRISKLTRFQSTNKMFCNTSVVLASVSFILLVNLTGSQCPGSIPENILIDSLVEELDDVSSEGGTSSVEAIHESNIICLASASSRGYLHMTIVVSLNYFLNSFLTNGVLQLTIHCNEAGGYWDHQHIFNQLLFQSYDDFGGGTATPEELLAADLETNCVDCQYLGAGKTNTPSFCIGEC